MNLPEPFSPRRGLVALGLVAIGFLAAAATRPDDRGPLLVTSALGATSAILFVVDPQSQTLASYEATPGATGGLRLLGARRIEHDLHLTRYRDLSEWSFSELKARYEAGELESGGKEP